MKTVYLAGNIAGLTYEQATDWRKVATTKLESAGFKVRDPMRNKEHLAGQVVGFTHDSQGCSAEEIFTRDIDDVDESDIILCKLDSVSIGSLFELGYEYAQDKSLIIVTTPELANHPFISESASILCKTVEDALDILIRLF